MIKSGGYPLTSNLAASGGRTYLLLSWAAIEGLVGFPLPVSSRKWRQWWANDATHAQSRSWLTAGFRVVNVDFYKETVEFQRIQSKDESMGVDMTDSDRVRAYVKNHYVIPARRAGSRSVTVRAGEVHRALKWDLKKVPQVCSALSTKKFLKSAGVELMERKGPPSGQSTTVEFTFRVLGEEGHLNQPDSEDKPIPNGAGLLALYGIAKETFRQLGGGEAFLKAERDWGPDVWERYELEEKERLAKEQAGAGK